MIVGGETSDEAVRDLQPHRFAMWHVDSPESHQLLDDPPNGVDSTSVRLVARSERDKDGHARIAEVYTQDGYWHVWVRDGDDSLGFIVGFEVHKLDIALWAAGNFLRDPGSMSRYGLGIAEKPEVLP